MLGSYEQGNENSDSVGRSTAKLFLKQESVYSFYSVLMTITTAV